MHFDLAVGSGGFAAGGNLLLPQWTRSVQFHGLEHIPTNGPVMVVSNHPGLTDTVALFAALPRSDVRIIAAERVFLRTLVHTMSYLLIMGETMASRQTAVRAAARHLRAGGTLLTFPAGHIEPDPALFGAAVASLDHWRGRVEPFARLVPDLTIVPVIVDGVVSAASLRNPLLRLRRSRRDRDWLAATLQVLLRRYQQVDVTVTFGAPVRVADHDPATIEDTVLAEARRIVHERVP